MYEWVRMNTACGCDPAPTDSPGGGPEGGSSPTGPSIIKAVVSPPATPFRHGRAGPVDCRSVADRDTLAARIGGADQASVGKDADHVDAARQSTGARLVAEPAQPLGEVGIDAGLQPRSAEHTAELQSLMRNSYAVFCLQ